MTASRLLIVQCLLINTIVFCVGCAPISSVHSYNAVHQEAAPSGKVLVYAYILPLWDNQNIPVHVNVNGKQVGDFKRGYYIKYVGTPGQLKFSTRLAWPFQREHERITLTAESGKTYYLRFSYVDSTAEWVRDEVGASEITQCKALQ